MLICKNIQKSFKDGTNDINTNWEIYKIKSDGEIDWSGHVWTESITTWEDEFDLDLNGDGNKSGQVSLTNRNTDTTGAILASEGVNGALYIVDGNSQIAINDSWIESSSNWGDGSYSSTAIAVSVSLLKLFAAFPPKPPIVPR